MNPQPKHFDTIVRPVITEKATLASAGNAIVFETAIGANKMEIKEAVEALFSVKVHSVNTVVVKGKRKRFRNRIGRRKDVKKAYVRLEEGYTLDTTLGI